jgi:D-amino-acid dehydrogenase
VYEAIVVGGGIVGSSVAYHLARDGVEVALVDRRHEGRATDAGAGIVSPPTSSRSESDAWFGLAAAALGYYPALAERLADEQDGDVGFGQPGLLAVAPPGREDAFATVLERTRGRQAATGHPAPGSVDELAPAEATDLFPPLAAPARAFHYRDAGRVDGRTFAGALRRAGERHGVETVDATVASVRVEDGAVAGVVADGQAHDASAVVVAGGAWSRSFGADLGVTVPVDPHRGQICHLDAGTDASDWPMVTVVGGEYLVPWPDGRVAAGATREVDAGFDPRVTAGGVHEVLDETLAVAPGLADADLVDVKVGLRPASPDGLPVLGGVPDVDGAYLATGHGATGLTLGPYSGTLVAQAVRGESPEHDLGPFAVTRFDG